MSLPTFCLKSLRETHLWNNKLQKSFLSLPLKESPIQNERLTQLPFSPNHCWLPFHKKCILLSRLSLLCDLRVAVDGFCVHLSLSSAHPSSALLFPSLLTGSSAHSSTAECASRSRELHDHPVPLEPSTPAVHQWY